MSVEFRKFDFAAMRPFSSVLVIGGRRVGKTVLIEDFVRTIHIPCDVFTDAVDPGHWRTCTVHTTQTIASISGKVEHVSDRIREVMQSEQDSVVVFDDCCSGIHEIPNVREMAVNGRHYHKYVFYSKQSAVDINPKMFDYIVVCAEPAVEKRQWLWALLDPTKKSFPTFESFVKVMDMTTVDYKVIVYDLCPPSTALHDKVFWYRAKLPPSTHYTCPYCGK